MTKPNLHARSKGRRPRAGNGRLRLVAGQWRGRRLPVPDLPGLRPTPDRVRETLFNWLGPWVREARCLDLFCGTGALGLEALSRGAAHCIFVERQPRAAQGLRDNLARLEAGSRARVIEGDVAALLAGPEVQPMDLVLLDPPFHQQWLERCLPLLETGWLAAEARVYVESAVDEPLPALPAHWHLHRQRRAGQVSYRLYHVDTGVRGPLEAPLELA